MHTCMHAYRELFSISLSVYLWVYGDLLACGFGAYGIYIGLCECGVGPMGLPWVYANALWDLWGSHGSMGLRCWTYGMPRGLWDFSVAPLGFRCACGIAV